MPHRSQRRANDHERAGSGDEVRQDQRLQATMVKSLAYWIKSSMMKRAQYCRCSERNAIRAYAATLPDTTNAAPQAALHGLTVLAQVSHLAKYNLLALHPMRKSW